MQPSPAQRDTRPPGDTPEVVSEHVLLVTKLALPPVRADLVPRPRLTNLLHLGIQRPLTLIAAPAGFGKTTLLSTWLKHAPLPTAWLSLERADDDLTRFWFSVFTALEGIQPGSAASALALLEVRDLRPLPPIETILTVWINGLATLSHEVALVLDDYHLIMAPAIHHSVTYLVDHLPSQMHLILAARADPPLPLARLRARGHLTEIRAADLRFTTAEAGAFLTRTLSQELSSEDIAALEARTEGWIAGLQLAALAMQGRTDLPAFLAAFSGSHHYIIDYLVEEVLACQPEPVQTFLLQTAILERLQGPLCEAVIGESGVEASGRVLLEQVEQANLFLTPLDEERRWYRYHPLFAEALRHRLQRGQRDFVPELHRRASRWYEQQGMTRDAIHHALAAADFEQAAHLIEQAAEWLVKRGDLATLRSWLEALPAELVRSRVELGLWHGWLLTQTGQFDAAERLLQELEHHLRPNPTRPPPQGVSQRLSEYAGRVAMTRAYMAFRRGDAPRTIALALEALEQLPENQMDRGLVAWYLGIAYLWNDDLAAAAATLKEASRISLAADNRYVACMATFELAQTQARQGHLHQADQSYQQALELATDRGGQLVAAGPAHVGRGDLQREWDHLEMAADSLHEGVAQCQQAGNASTLLLGYVALARVRQAQGDAAGAEALIQDIAQRLRTSHLAPLNTAQITAWHARLALAQGDLALAVRWVQERQVRGDDALSAPREIEYQTLARVLIAQQRPEAALPLVARLVALAEQQGRMGNALEHLALLALVQQACGDEAGALTTLARALSLAEPERYIRLFVDEGLPMARLLVQMRARRGGEQSGSTGYRDRLLARLQSAAHAGEPQPSIVVSGPGGYPFSEALSERELAVLRLIVAGCSNQEIADRLVLAVNTVKWYIKALYGKLQVESRTKAIARAKELHLVD